jgi:hypothetical protein
MNEEEVREWLDQSADVEIAWVASLPAREAAVVLEVLLTFDAHIVPASRVREAREQA